MNVSDDIGCVASEGDLFASAAAQGDLRTDAPRCPGWGSTPPTPSQERVGTTHAETPVNNGADCESLSGAREVLRGAPEAAAITSTANGTWVDDTFGETTVDGFSDPGQEHHHKTAKSLKVPTRILGAVAPLLLVLGACGDSDETSSSDTAVSTSDTAASTSDVRQLTFTGSDCLYEGPEEVTAGVVTVELVNESDGNANVFVGRLDEGETVQDLFDVFGPEPRTGSPEPWVSDMGGQSPASAGETIRWESSLAAGQYITSCTRSGNAWFGGGFTVVDG